MNDSTLRKYGGQPVHEALPGQCIHCREQVVKVLVSEPEGRRSWVCVDIGPRDYITHRCPIRQAA
jgi:hypothetical protein